MKKLLNGNVLLLGLFLISGCSTGQPPANPEEADQATMESGLQALPPGMEQNTAKQAMEQFYETGQISPELRKKLQDQGQQVYGGQYPGAGQRPPGR